MRIAQFHLTFIFRYSLTLLGPVIKADAYGHGIEVFSRVAGQLNIPRLCLVENWEAASIRYDTLNPYAHSLDLIRVRSAAIDDYYYTVDLSILITFR